MQSFKNLNVAQQKILLLNLIPAVSLILFSAGISFGFSYWVMIPILSVAGLATTFGMGLFLHQSKVLEAAKSARA